MSSTKWIVIAIAIAVLLIAALVVIASAVAWGMLGHKVSNNVNKVAHAVDSATDSSLEILGYKK